MGQFARCLLACGGGSGAGLKEGEEIELHVVGERSLEVARKTRPQEQLSRLRRLRGRLPADCCFDRVEVNDADRER